MNVDLAVRSGIHAYLSGDIVECMARSEKVLNTGFCPRADRDSVELFTAALTFSPKNADEAHLRPKKRQRTQGPYTSPCAADERVGYVGN